MPAALVAAIQKHLNSVIGDAETVWGGFQHKQAIPAIEWMCRELQLTSPWVAGRERHLQPDISISVT